MGCVALLCRSTNDFFAPPARRFEVHNDIFIYVLPYKIFSRLRRGDFRYTKKFNDAILGTRFFFLLDLGAFYQSTLHKHFTQALYPNTLSKHFTQALYQSTLHKNFIQALYTSTLHKHFIKALYPSTLSRYYKDMTNVLRPGIKTR